MRRLVPEQVRTWLTRARETWADLRGRVESRIDLAATDERKRFLAYIVAASAVTSALLLQWMLGGAAGAPRFWLFHLAIALTALSGSAAATLVAALLSVLAARVSSTTPLSAAFLLGLEGLLIGLVVIRATRTIRRVRRDLEVSVRSIRALESAVRHGTRMNGALSRLDQASEETALILLDHAGSISDWRTGATRLYGFEPRDILGAGAATLFDEPGRTTVPRLLADARAATTRCRCRHVRADGTVFEAEIEVSPLSPNGLDGYTMIVHDLTHQQAQAAADWSTAEAQAQLRGEVELAQRQLSTLREVTDPALNVLDAVPFVAELLGRLRTAIHAEGIALIDVERQPRRVFCASDGLQIQDVHHRPVAVNTDTARTVMIHNDPAGVAEVSAAVWPDGVSSLIAVPVVRAGATTAVMEVVNRPGRRATEWDIALVQVVAARIAGFLEDGSQVKRPAMAWTAPGSSADSRFVPESDLRLTLDDRVSDSHQSADGQQG